MVLFYFGYSNALAGNSEGYKNLRVIRRVYAARLAAGEFDYVLPSMEEQIKNLASPAKTEVAPSAEKVIKSYRDYAREKRELALYHRRHRRAAALRKAEEIRKNFLKQKAEKRAAKISELALLRKRYSKLLKAKMEGNVGPLSEAQEAKLKVLIAEENAREEEKSAFFRAIKAQKKAAAIAAREAAIEAALQESSSPLHFVEKVKTIFNNLPIVHSRKARISILEKSLSLLEGRTSECELSFLGFEFKEELEAQKFLIELLHFRTPVGMAVYDLEPRTPWCQVPQDIMAAIDYYWNLFVVHSYEHYLELTPNIRKFCPKAGAVGNAPWSVVTPLVSTLVDWCKMSFFANLVDRTEQAMKSVLGSFFSRLGSLTTMFWEFVEFLKEKVKSFLDEHWFAITVASSLILSFCSFIAVLIAVGMFCKLASWIGFGPAAVASVITLLGGAFLGLYGMMHLYDKSWDQMLAKIVNFFCSKDILDDHSEEVIGNAMGDLFSPFWWLLTKLVPAVQLNKAGPIVGAGQLGNSMSGISKLCTSFKEFGTSFIDYLSRIADTTCNYSGGAIRSINLVLREDFVQWCEEIEKYATDTYESLIIGKLVRLKKLRILKDREQQFLKIFLDPLQKMPTAAVHMFDKARAQLNEALHTIGICKFLDTEKATPFSLWLYSDTSGTGKSSAQKRLMDTLLDTLGYPKTQRFYQRGNGLKFWDNYEHQYVCAFDDLSALPDTELDWFQVITDERIPIAKAAIGEKGMIFTSDFVVASSNLTTHRNDSLVGCAAAFNNRRHLMLEVRKNPDYTADGGCTTFSQYAIRHPTVEGFPYLDKMMVPQEQPIWYSEEAINDILYEVYKAHNIRCSQAFANSGNHISRGLQSSTARDFFFLLRHKLQSEILSEEQFTTLDLLIDNVVYSAGNRKLGLKPHIMAGDQRLRFQLTDMLINLDDLLPIELMHDCLAFLPFETRGVFYKAILERDEYPFECESLYHPFELYIFDRILRSGSLSSGGTLGGFKGMIAASKNLLKSIYDKVLEKAPMYMKICLGVGFFFLFGYGFYLACKQVTAACTGIAGLGACLAAGNGPQSGGAMPVSGDERIKQKEREQNVTYARSVIPSGSKNWTMGFSWADEPNDFYGNGLTSDIRLQAVEAFEHVNPYICSMVKEVVNTSGTKSIFKGYMLGGRVLLMVKHVWDYIVTTGSYTLRRQGRKERFILNKTYTQTIPVEGKDLIMIKLPDCVSLSDDGGFKMLQPKDLTIPRVGPAFCFTPKLYEDKVVNEGVEFTDFYDSQKFTRYSIGSKTIPVTSGCSYKSGLTAGDCGSVIFFPGTGKEQSKPIPGLMHVADGKNPGDVEKTGLGVFITQQDCANWVKLSPAIAVGNGPELYSKKSYVQESCVIELGQLNASDCVRSSGNTQIIPSLISKIIEVPKETAPAILSNDDPRIKVSETPNFDVYRDGMRKYAEMAGPMTDPSEPDTDADFKDAISDAFEELISFEDSTPEERNLKRESATTLKVVSDDIALNGITGEEYFDAITSGTSEGHPWVKQRPPGCKGKGWLLDGAPGAWSINEDSEFGKSYRDLEEGYRSGKNRILIGIDHPKDETVTLPKCTTRPKTRLFTVLPAEYNLLVRKYFLEFVVFYMRQHNRCPGKVGINPTGIEWQLFHEKLRAMGTNWFNGDFKRFDGITPRDVLLGISNAINKLYCATDHETLLVDNRVRTALLMSASDRLGIAGKSLYRINSGIPSGFALTVIINSLVNEFFIRYAWKRLCREYQKPEWVHRSIFRRNVVFGVYGDDNLVSVSNNAKDIFNLVTISKFLSRYGITLVNGQCKEQVDFPPFSPNPTDCDFLKRRMIVSEENGRVLAPLSVTSIYGRLHWIRISPDPGAATIENCASALFEAYHHGRSFYFELYRKIFDACSLVNLPTCELPSFEECEARFLASRNNLKNIVDVPIVTLLASELKVRVQDKVWLAGICVNSVFLNNKFVVWCGATPLHKRYINFSFVNSANGGYCTKSSYLRGISSFPTDRDIVFLSSNGLSHAVPPMLLYLRKCLKMREEVVDNIRALCEAESGSPCLEWSRLFDVQEEPILLVNGSDHRAHDISEAHAHACLNVVIPVEGICPNHSLKVTVRSMLEKCRSGGQYPILLEKRGLSFGSTGMPGAKIEQELAKAPHMWHRYQGQNAKLVACSGFLCHKKCPGHVEEAISNVKVVSAGEENPSLKSFYQFITLNGKTLDSFDCKDDHGFPERRSTLNVLRTACIDI
nr:MAG: polyprotein [Secoviridae sp.]